MTNPSETAVLAALRRTTLAYLSDLDFKEVEKAVERDGILSLRGSVAKIVISAVEKHGSHNQSSHGRGGGSGGGGGGGGSTSLPDRKTPVSEERIASEISTVTDKARDVTDGLANNPFDDPVRDLARKKAFSMRESLDKASSAKTPEGRKEGLKSARAKIPAIIEILEEQNYNSEAAEFAELSTNIGSVITMLPKGN